jgi:hypothetical protein
MDGPVVAAAREALERRDVGRILPYVKADREAEVRAAFERTMAVRDGDAAVNEVADLYFYETVVRVHRAGEGAPYTGLKPAGLPQGPVVPVAERAIATGDPTELVTLLRDKATAEVERRFRQAMVRQRQWDDSIASARAYVEAVLGLEVWAHDLYMRLDGAVHEGRAPEAHGHG